MKPNDTQKKAPRGKRGNGRLYKRDLAGKEYPASSKVHGAFWLQFQVSGKRIRQRLLDENGESITSRKKAEAARAKIFEPLHAKDRLDQLRLVQSKLSEAEEIHAAALEVANPPLRISEAWKAYENSTERPDSGAETLRRYCGHWDRFAGWIKKTAPNIKHLRDITPELARRYAGSFGRGKASPNTFNKHTGFLKLFFKVLEDEAKLSVNPFEKIKRKKLKTEVRRELSIEELQAVLEAAGGELKTLLYIGTFTGLRLGDCCTLKWGEVDLVRGIIRRVPSKTKSRNAKPVTIGIPVALLHRIEEIPKSKRRGYVVPKYATLYTFTNREGKAIRQSEITREIQTHFERLGIQTHKEGTGYRLEPDPDRPGEFKKVYTGKRAVVEVGFHSLRHTYVSLQAEHGTPQAVVQAIVGHGNPAMTQHYTHIGEQAAKQAALAMPSNIVDAEFEILHDPLPAWAVELAEKLNSKNWKTIKAKLLNPSG